MIPIHHCIESRERIILQFYTHNTHNDCTEEKKNIKLQNTHTDMTDSHNDIRMKNDTV